MKRSLKTGTKHVKYDSDGNPLEVYACIYICIDAYMQTYTHTCKHTCVNASETTYLNLSEDTIMQKPDAQACIHAACRDMHANG